MKMNKRGNILVIVVFALILVVIMVMGFVAIMGSSILNWVADTAIPPLTSIGVVGNSDRAVNFSESASLVLTPVNALIQNLTWITGILYVMALIGCVGFAVTARAFPSKWLIGFYFVLTVMLVITAVFISQMYENVSTGTDELSTRMQEHTILNHFVLYSPLYMTIIMFLTGIVLFSGMQQEEFI